MSYSSYLAYFPFLPEGNTILADSEVTGERIDDTNVFDTLLRDAATEIVKSVTVKDYHKSLEMVFGIEQQTQVLKFYITMVLLSKLSIVVLNRYLKFYRKKMDRHISWITENERWYFDMMDMYLEVIQKTDPKLDIKYDEKKNFIVRVPKYSLLSSTIPKRDNEHYAPILLINMPIQKGNVLLLKHDWNMLTMFLNKVIENRIREIVKNLKEFESAKINKSVKEIRKYMVSKNDIDPTTSFNDIKYQLQEKEQVDKVFYHLTATDFKEGDERLPPCINYLIASINDGRILTHAENVLLGSFLEKKGFVFDQIYEIFKKATNFDENITRYNIEYLIEKQLTPMNCNKIDSHNMCHKSHDTQNRCSRIKNPLTY